MKRLKSLIAGHVFLVFAVFFLHGFKKSVEYCVVVDMSFVVFLLCICQSLLQELKQSLVLFEGCFSLRHIT